MRFQPSGGNTIFRCVGFLILSLSLLLTGGFYLSFSLLARPLRQGKPKSLGMSAERLQRLDQVVEQAIAAGEAPGAVLLVARKGKKVYQKAYGMRAVSPSAEPMTLDTIFDLASLTKVIATATSIMILVEEGKLSLTDPVVRYLSGFGVNDKVEITLLQLLTHFSGLRPDLDLDTPWSGYETAINLALNEKLETRPGERFIYSDINFMLLAEIIRVVSGQRVDEFAEKRIFAPLGMKETGFLPRSEKLPRVAPTEGRDGKLLRGEVHDPTAFRMGGVAGHAGLFSTVDDVAIFAQMLLNGGVYDKVRILSPLGAYKMTTQQSPPGQNDLRAIGFDVRTRFSTVAGDLFPPGSFGHTGFTGTSLWIDPFTETFVILFTSRLHPEGKGDVVSLRKKVASVVASSLIEMLPLREQPAPR
ncbi:MAG: serine hydrolase [Acidobacteria bacterium]|nr:serine hydrolase [Acidobacteriota bacterium]